MFHFVRLSVDLRDAMHASDDLARGSQRRSDMTIASHALVSGIRTQTRTLLALAIAALAAAGCGSSNNNGTNPQGDGGGADATVDSGGNGDGSSSGSDVNSDSQVVGCTLKHFGEVCLVDGDCCSQRCDPGTNTCAASVANCHGTGGACSTGLDCCSLACVGGQCANQCVADNMPCTSDAECCGQKCAASTAEGGTGMTCTPLSTSCSSAGNPCTTTAAEGGASTNCCSGLCGTGGTCVLQSSFCIQTNDICNNNNDCCTGLCSADLGDAGGGVGVCVNPPNLGGSNCSGAADGTLCTSCGGCCSALCAPYITGVNVCQPAIGCHVVGDLCRSAADCCSADPNRPDAGDTTGVDCVKGPGEPVGYCTGPNGCRPLGETCHLKNYSCSNSTKANDCCAIGGPSNKICAVDPLGVPRCASGVCVGSGGSCTNSLDCCLPDGGLCYGVDDAGVGVASGCLPCVPAPGGSGFVCAAPNDAGTYCRGDAQTCTVNADCCASLMCNIPPGGTVGSCKPISTPPPPPADGGVSDSSIPVDAPTCALYGQSCTMSSDCCNGIPCAIGSVLCAAGQTGCTCHYTVQ
jgi:hypothetical protein